MKRGCLVVLLVGALYCLLYGIAFRAIAAADSSSPQVPSQPTYSGNSGWWDAIVRGGPVGPILGNHSSELGEFHITGFLQSQTGMWVNSSNLREFTGKQNGGTFPKVRIPHSNSLATERNWMSVDTNYTIGPNSFFVRWYGAYEPAYPNENNLHAAGPRTEGPIPDFYNQHTVRDAWWKIKEGPFTLFTGRQISTWGESVSFRVGDVINPQDISYAFGFANLEQSRNPLWMLHPIIELPAFGPHLSNDIEAIFVPGLQPLYTNDDYPDDRQMKRHNVLGSVFILPPATGARFAGRPYPCALPVQLKTSACANGLKAAFPQVVGALGKTHWYFPPATWNNAEEGVRLHTFVSNTEVSAFYWHAHQMTPTNFVSGPVGHQFLSARFPHFDDVAITGNTPLYLPGTLGSLLPFVIRGEGVWQDATPFNTRDIRSPSAVEFSSTFNTLLALDLSSVYAPWLSQTGPLNARLEWNNFTILSPSKSLVYGGTAFHRYHNDESFLLQVGTSWLWNEIQPTLTGIYNPDGTTFQVFPDLLLLPHWTNKYTLDLKFIGVFGKNKYGAQGGNLKGKSLLIMTWQYNFNLL
jgi:hypothetical protein